jgi:hypothetical protein
MREGVTATYYEGLGTGEDAEAKDQYGLLKWPWPVVFVRRIEVSGISNHSAIYSMLLEESCKDHVTFPQS